MSDSRPRTRKTVHPFLLAGLIGICTIGTGFTVQLYRAYGGNDAVWWTPVSMKRPFKESRNRFRLYLSGQPLSKHLEQGTLWAKDDQGERYRVVEKDLSVRLNHWPEVKASILSGAIVNGVLFGAALTLFAIGLAQVLGRSKTADHADQQAHPDQ
jgi:hypothetical protein